MGLGVFPYPSVTGLTRGRCLPPRAPLRPLPSPVPTHSPFLTKSVVFFVLGYSVPPGITPTNCFLPFLKMFLNVLPLFIFFFLVQEPLSVSYLVVLAPSYLEPVCLILPQGSHLLPGSSRTEHPLLPCLAASLQRTTGTLLRPPRPGRQVGGLQFQGQSKQGVNGLPGELEGPVGLLRTPRFSSD